MNTNEKEYNTLILGALLHDIGKFIQRSEEYLFFIKFGRNDIYGNIQI